MAGLKPNTRRQEVAAWPLPPVSPLLALRTPQIFTPNTAWQAEASYRAGRDRAGSPKLRSSQLPAGRRSGPGPVADKLNPTAGGRFPRTENFERKPALHVANQAEFPKKPSTRTSKQAAGTPRRGREAARDVFSFASKAPRANSPEHYPVASLYGDSRLRAKAERSRGICHLRKG